GKQKDADLLRFLAAVFASDLFAYTAFHAGSNLGIGRDQIHVYESLTLPFPLPDDELAVTNAAEIVREAASIIKSVEKKSAQATTAKRTELVENAKGLLEPLVGTYFSVSENERILIADTLTLWQPSIHKQN